MKLTTKTATQTNISWKQESIRGQGWVSILGRGQILEIFLDDKGNEDWVVYNNCDVPFGPDVSFWKVLGK